MLIEMPMKVRLVVGPTSLSSAIGTPKVLKVDLKVSRSSCACEVGDGAEARS